MKLWKVAPAALAALISLVTSAAAQDWPSRPIMLIVPFAAGGGVDTSTRLQAAMVGELLGQTIVIKAAGISMD